jgi:hypothetical protein
VHELSAQNNFHRYWAENRPVAPSECSFAPGFACAASRDR